MIKGKKVGKLEGWKGDNLESWKVGQEKIKPGKPNIQALIKTRKEIVLMERIFWVECPKCAGRFYCDYELRHSEYELFCPFCQTNFLDKDSPWIDDRVN